MTTSPAKQITDVLGIKAGSKTHKAVSMYMRKNGATSKEVSKENGQPYLNVLKRIEAMGHKVTKKAVKGTDGRERMHYSFTLSSKAKLKQSKKK